MSILSKRMGCVRPSPTLEVSRLAAQLRAQGVDIVSLGAGEPDFDTPDHIKAAAIDAINAGKTKYTPVDGIAELKDAISMRMHEDYGLSYSREQILVGAGAKQCIYNLFVATLDPGDEVIIPAPYWVSYPDIVEIAGGKPVILECGKDFKLSAESLENAITDNTKWLIINSPGNPTGVVYSRRDLREIADVLLKHPHVQVMADDIYAKLVYNVEFVNILQVESALYSRVFIVNGVSKAYSMTGWRIGYIMGESSVIQAIAALQSQSTTNPNSMAQAAAVAALSGDHSFLNKRLQIFLKRRNAVIAALSTTDLLSVNCPDGAFYIFVSCKNTIGKKIPDGTIIGDGTDFSKYLIKHRVAVVPGAAFGAPEFFRVSYATSDEQLAEACNRIIKACALIY